MSEYCVFGVMGRMGGGFGKGNQELSVLDMFKTEVSK